MKTFEVIKNKFEVVIYMLRKIYKKRKVNRLANNNFSLIASNCTGGVILHDLDLKFNTPFINLSLPPKDFIKLIANFKYYMSLEVEEFIDERVAFPVGKLGDLRIDFMHYASFKEAKNKWDERKRRINYDNLFFILTERDGCSFNDLLEFDNLPIKRKVVFTHKEYPTIKSSFYIKGFENSSSIGLSMHYPKFYSIKRYIDQFDFVKWVNDN